LVEEVVAIVGELLAPFGPNVATITVEWAPAAGMWFIEVVPARRGAASVSVGIDDRGEFLVSFGHTHFEMWRSKKEPPPVAELREVLAAIFGGDVEEAGTGGDRFARITLPSGKVRSVGSVRLPLPWRRRKRSRFEPYAP
jgi:hypothetical protein